MTAASSGLADQRTDRSAPDRTAPDRPAPEHSAATRSATSGCESTAQKALPIIDSVVSIPPNSTSSRFATISASESGSSPPRAP